MSVYAHSYQSRKSGPPLGAQLRAPSVRVPESVWQSPAPNMSPQAASQVLFDRGDRGARSSGSASSGTVIPRNVARPQARAQQVPSAPFGHRTRQAQQQPAQMRQLGTLAGRSQQGRTQVQSAPRGHARQAPAREQARAAEPVAPRGPTAIVNAPQNELRVRVQNEVATHSLPLDVLPRSSFLTRDGSPQNEVLAQVRGDFTQNTGAYEFPSGDLQLDSDIVLDELVVEIGGEIHNHDTYLGAVPEDIGGVRITIGGELLTDPLPVRCLADYLQYGKLRSYDFAAPEDGNQGSARTVLHHFVIPLTRQSRATLLKRNEKLRVEITSMDLSRVSARHRFVVRWHEL